ncbi:hypothetical protein GCM10023220_29550 [Streptomyces ziwulingensis]|uniref:Uncharacterized protein n=1 Tax=Streptomyces ziwulingensis TaxID=1045501 RepID=A0ABP9BW30_9ACTN
MPEAVERPPRRDDTAADAGSLERLGVLEPQPVPEPAADPLLEPVHEDPGEPIPDDAA